MASQLKELLSKVSNQPGVYLMKDETGKVIYVGKAGNLKKRLSSYFVIHNGASSRINAKTRALVEKIHAFETIITASEKEALVLEATLIKQYRPRYNVILKDDKRYPSLCLDLNNPYPNLTIVRKTDKKEGALYFGPYPSAAAVRNTLKLINKTFKLRKCKSKTLKAKPRPCLNYQIGTCLAPCSYDVDPAVYQSIVNEVILFLKGKTGDLIKQIKKEMVSAAEQREYERAAVLRDKLFSLERTLEKQVAVTTDFQDRDVIGFARSPEITMITLFTIRDGYLLGTRQFSFSETIAIDMEIIESFLRQYYDKTDFIPREILSPLLLDNTDLLSGWLSEKKGFKVNILYPQRGKKRHLIKMAQENAEKRLKDELNATQDLELLLHRLQKQLRLSKIPMHIECFDNSTFGGSEPVAGCVVYKNGKPSKTDYRKYRIKTVSVPDDYAYMAEVLKRRFRGNGKTLPYPDLLMVDGGKGQLNIARSVIGDLALDGLFEIIGIAKKDETKGETEDKIYKAGRSNPIHFGREGDLLLFLQGIRDEAHRFAITFQRKRRSKSALKSAVDGIPGIGPKRKKALIQHFGGVNRIRSATIEELAVVPGISQGIAETVRQYFSTKD